jgi:hypothetical protein
MPGTPAFTWRARVHVDVTEPLEYGANVDGARRVVPVVGGEVSGEWTGRILAGGADWQTVLDDGSVLIQARYPVHLDGVGDVVFNVRGARPSGSGAHDFCTSLMIQGPDEATVPRPFYVTVGSKSVTGVDYDVFEVQ